jgi:hypothetical protein
MQAASYIAQTTTLAAPIQYKWSEKKAYEYVAVMDGKSRLFLAIEKSLARAQYAVGLAAAEWSVRRLEHLADVSDCIHRIEAAWAKISDPCYGKPLKFRMAPGLFSKLPEVDGPLKIATVLVFSLDSRIQDRDRPIAETSTNQVNLARFVVPNPKAFDGWLKQVLPRVAKYFPNAGDPYIETDLPVVRELCDPDFDYTPEAVEKARKAFLASLDWKTNPYLNSPAEMKALGFTGAPYVD